MLRLRGRSAALAAGGLVLALAGCASPRERDAWQRIGAVPVPLPAAPEERALPELEPQGALSDYLAYAAMNNPGLEAAFHRWRSALERIPQARALPDPKFTYSYYIQEVETRVGPQQQAFGIMQALPWYGKLKARGDAAIEGAEAAERQYQAVKLKLFSHVHRAYTEYAYLARALAVTEENVRLLSELESVARARFKVGTTAHPMLLKAQVELGRLDDRAKSLRNLRPALASRLNAALGRAADAPLPWPVEIPEERAAFEDDALLRDLEEANPELQALGSMVAKEEAGLTLAHQAYIPDIAVGVNVIDTDEALMAVPDSGKDPIVATVSVDIPLWFQKYRAAEREAEARVRAALRERDDRGHVLAADLKMAIFQYHDAERKIDLYRDTLVPKAEQALATSRQAFTADKASLLDVIDAERSLLDFKLSADRALADRAIQLAEIEQLVGRALPRPEEER